MTVAGFRKVETAAELKNPFSTLKNAVQNGILIVTERHDTSFHVNLRCDKPNAVIDIEGKKGGISRYIFDEKGRVRYRVDNNDHGNAKNHPFQNGEHYHTAIWDVDQWQRYSSGAEIPEGLRRLCADILKER